MSVRELYDARFEVLASSKWREQLLDREAHKRNTATDVAEMVLALEEGVLSDMLAFSVGDHTLCYLARESGVWAEVNGKELHQMYAAMSEFCERLDAAVIRPLKSLVRRLRTARAAGAAPATPTATSGSSDVPDERTLACDQAAAEEHLAAVAALYEKLRTPAFASGVMKRIISMRVAAADAAGLHPGVLDTARACIAFTDGVFCFSKGRLLRGPAAKALYQTHTVGYSFEEMAEALGLDAEAVDEPGAIAVAEGSEADLKVRSNASAAWRTYDAFVSKIYSSSPPVRGYVMDLMGSSALNENRQVLVIHYNVGGANGKTTIFVMFKQAFGAYFVKCSSGLLNPASFSSPSGPNEELMSARGKRVVLFSEPSSKLKLSSSTIKELTGGDEQSTRALYGKKVVFVINGVVHVLCNRIPEFDDMDEGGTQRRLRVASYGSTFVDAGSPLVCPANHVYAREDVSPADARTWRFCMMWEIMVAASRREAARQRGEPPRDEPPEVVLSATRELIERDSTLEAFLRARLERTGNSRDHVSLKTLYEDYKEFCTTESRAADKKSGFKGSMVAALGAIMEASNKETNFWKGWRLREVEVADTASPMERRFKAELESETGAAWRKVRPEWLLNPETGVPMELDMFCPALRTAVEYNGRQHYEFPNGFHTTREQFEAQQRRDMAKAEICRTVGVRLVVVDAMADVQEEMAQWRAALAGGEAPRRRLPDDCLTTSA